MILYMAPETVSYSLDKAETCNIVPEFQCIKGLPDLNYLHQNTPLPGGRLAVDCPYLSPNTARIHSSGAKHR